MAYRERVIRYRLIGDQNGRDPVDILKDPLESIGLALNYKSDDTLATALYKEVIQVTSSELIDAGFESVPAEMDVAVKVTVTSKQPSSSENL